MEYEIGADIHDGASNAVAPAPGYTAGAGWDACTGLGRLNGAALLSALQKQGTDLGDVFNIPATA